MEENQNNAGTAANVQNNQQGNNQQAQQNTIDYGKIQSMIDKGTQQKETAILKSYFEQQGLTGDEITQACNDFKANKQAEADKHKNDFANMQAENAKLKAQILNDSIHTKASKISAELGVDAKNVDYAIRLADFSKVVNEKNEVSEGAIKTALEQVVKDLPALKGSKDDAAGFKLGASSNGGDKDAQSAQDELRKMFGVKTK